jgi:hypothetical protein
MMGQPFDNFEKIGAPDTIRTCDRLVRSQVLYPAELQAREGGYYKDEVYMSQGLMRFRGAPGDRIARLQGPDTDASDITGTTCMI